MVPDENLELVAPLVAEYEQARIEGIELERIRHDRGQAVDGFAHVGGAAGQVNANRVARGQHYSGSSAETTARSNAASKPEATSIVAQPTRTVRLDVGWLMPATGTDNHETSLTGVSHSVDRESLRRQ